MLTARLCLGTQDVLVGTLLPPVRLGAPGLPEWSAPSALASNCRWSCPLLVIAPTLPLDQGDLVAFVRVRAGQVYLGRHPSIELSAGIGRDTRSIESGTLFLGH
jgi:hypothetical protein